MEHSHDETHQCTCPRQGFTRQETILLASVTSSRLAYLDRQKVIVPQKSGSPNKPHILYSWEQVLQIRVLAYFKQKISLALTKKIVRHFNDVGLAENWGDRHLVIVGDEIYSVVPDWSNMPEIMRSGYLANGKNEFTVVVAPCVERIIDELWARAIDSELIDTDSFIERAKTDAPVLLNC